ncbi:RmlC-like jelly roll fold [Phytophthora cinnamomi]|uniref:RmlC-like jelly roll fold n=1 Tax=Phytophthora cinnamomi TaxID=4785 RepID=UPI003559CDEA|nr:RmlC-like jelly roll fold [Phytophthora cinnamomi]
MHPAALKRFPTLRKNSFLYQLQDQIQIHRESEPQRQRQKEVKEIYRILQRVPEAREAHEIDTLYEWVLRNGSTNKIFQGAQEIICKTICREMTLLELPAQGVVCYQGDYGDTFYVIISGSVSLFINARPRQRLTLEEEDNNSKAYSADEEDVKLQPDQYGTFIKHITDGGTFGELAVMDPTARRSCTIICDEPTSFICLKRGAYQRLIRITNSSQLDFTQVEFLETMYFFDGWPHGELTRLSNRLRQVHYPADSYLTRIGAEANVVFFIYAGMRETWKELFYMHALDHIRDSFTKFRKLADARENWRKTRVKLALANPGLILTM